MVEATSHFGTEGHFGAGGLAAPSRRIRLSKIYDYLTDNVSCTRLSDFEACGQ